MKKQSNYIEIARVRRAAHTADAHGLYHACRCGATVWCDDQRCVAAISPNCCYCQPGETPAKIGGLYNY